MKFQQELQTIKGEKNPPKWASKATHYYENEHGEQWIAHIEKGILYVSGLDIGWDVMKGTLEDVKDYLEIKEEVAILANKKNFDIGYAQILLKRKADNPFGEYSLNQGETKWFEAVIESALLHMEYYENKEKELV
jgi:hypothetical protein